MPRLNSVHQLLLACCLCTLLLGAGYSTTCAAPAQAEPRARLAASTANGAEGQGMDLLQLQNLSSDDILDIRLQQGKEISFIRLDLAPEAQDAIENPAACMDVRVDTGLQLHFYDKLDLGRLNALTFCGEHPACLIILTRNGKSQHIKGRVQELLPPAAENLPPVCALSSFKPGMTMNEVCAFLQADSPRDANEAVLTRLGFAGLVWAARLTPRQTIQDGKLSAEDALGHLELRRTLTPQTLEKLMQTLYQQNYVPWQAEFPGLDMDFTEMEGLDSARKKAMLQQTVDFFMSAGKDEASIMLAPQHCLPALADADAPQDDVQLFTVTLRKATHMLLVDVTGFEHNEDRR